MDAVGAARSLRTVAIYCGSNTGLGATYLDGARRLGACLARAEIRIVFGGTHKGLMGALADAALAAGGEIHGVITERLHGKGHLHPGLTSHEILTTMGERKTRMIELADAFIALPGGIGTLEEFMEAWTLNQLGYFDKPAGLYNVAGYYDAFMGFIDHMIAEAFLPAAHRHSIVVESDEARLLARLKAFVRTDVPKWMS